MAQSDVLDDFRITAPRWTRLLERGVDSEEVDVRRGGDAFLLEATARLQLAVEALAAHLSACLEASTPDEFAEVFQAAGDDRVFPAYEEARAEYERQVRLAIRFVAGLDAADAGIELYERGTS